MWKNIEKWLVSNGLRYPFFSFPVLCLPILFHVARHTCATLLLYRGVSITTVQTVLGHQSVKTTQIYSAVTDLTIEKELKKANGKRNRVGKERKPKG